MTTEGKGLCPICFQNGIKYDGNAQGLVSHLETDHTVKDVVQQLAAAAIAMHPGPGQEQPKCQAHGETACDLCSLNPGECLEAYGFCGIYLETGMHWDTCPNRIRSYEDAVERLIRCDIDDMGVFYQFTSKEGQ